MKEGTLGFQIEVLHVYYFWEKIPDFTFIRDYVTVIKVCSKTLLFSTYLHVYFALHFY